MDTKFREIMSTDDRHLYRFREAKALVQGVDGTVKSPGERKGVYYSGFYGDTHLLLLRDTLLTFAISFSL
jgi:hypothetical protein